MKLLCCLVLAGCGLAQAQLLQQILLGSGAASGPGTWTLVQTFATVQDGTNLSCVGSGCTLTGFTTTTAGNIGTITFKGANANSAFLSGVSTGTWSTPAGCQIALIGWNASSCAYSLSIPAVSSLSLSFTDVPGGAGDASVVFREWHYSTGSANVAFDSGGTTCAGNDGTATSHTGITPTLAGNDIVVQSIALTNGAQVTAVTVYGTLVDNSTSGGINILGEAVLLNTSTTTPPVWTTGFGDSSRCSLAIKGL